MMDENSFERAISEFRIKFTILLFNKIEMGLTKLSKDQVAKARLKYFNEESCFFVLDDEIEQNINDVILEEIITLWSDTLMKY